MNYMETLRKWLHATEPVTLSQEEREFFIKLAREVFRGECNGSY